MTHDTLRALVTCPWCDWQEEVDGGNRDELIEEGKRVAREHNADAGHPVKAGAEPRTGYYRGKPLH